MKTIIIGSIHRNAGKTSIITGIAKALDKKTAYLKPFGDRSFFHKKRLWDYDSALVKDILNLPYDLENITIGVEHIKLRSIYNEDRIRAKFTELLTNVSERDILFIEGGRDLAYGSSVHLDLMSVAKYTNAKVVIVVDGQSDSAMDDIYFLKAYVDKKNINFDGIIINKLKDANDFTNTYIDEIMSIGIKVRGLIPYDSCLTFISVMDLSRFLFAKLLTDDIATNNIIENIFLGLMTADNALRDANFNKENKLVVTTADREDMVITALESNTSGILFTNNIMPSDYIIKRAKKLKVPLLLVSGDAYTIEKRINSIEPLLTKDNTIRINILKDTMAKYVDIAGIIS